MTTQQIHQVKARETWLKVYQELGSVAKAARRCGIARFTLYRWIERFDKEGKEGLKDKSKRPHKLFRLKVTDSKNNSSFLSEKNISTDRSESALICSGITG